MSDRHGSDVGYRRPPISTRFRKGQSGNPSGRPKGRHVAAPYESVLGQTVTIREDGAERRVTAAEAFLLHTTKQGLQGDGAAARATMAAIETARATRSPRGEDNELVINIVAVTAPTNQALEALRMGKVLDRYRKTARTALEPWVVEVALRRLGEQALSVEEQQIIVKATRTPWKVNWPDWWSAGLNASQQSHAP